MVSDLVKKLLDAKARCYYDADCTACPNEEVCYRIRKLKSSLKDFDSIVGENKDDAIEDFAYCLDELISTLGCILVDKGGDV